MIDIFLSVACQMCVSSVDSALDPSTYASARRVYKCSSFSLHRVAMSCAIHIIFTSIPPLTTV